MSENNLSRQPLPFSDWCFVCGSNNPRGVKGRFYRDGLRVWIEVTPDEHFNGYPNVLHGGVTAGLLDETMGWVAALAIDRMCQTAELNVRYIQPVPTETPLRVVGEPVKINRRMCSVKAELRVVGGDNGPNGLLAAATGKFIPMSEDETRIVDEKLIYEQGYPSIFPCCYKSSQNNE